MKYALPTEIVPASKRQEINNKIILLIDSEKTDQVGSEAIFQAYTGDGGLHGLNFLDYKNLNEFSKAKKEIENGQFFTPANLCEKIVSCVPVQSSDLVADLCSGMGNFFNFLPVESNLYGCEIDNKSFKVSRHLYPFAQIENRDVRFYNPGLRFDCIFGNPPFNLDWDTPLGKLTSQMFYMLRSAELLVPGGILAVVVPMSFMADVFMAGSAIEQIDTLFSFLGQSELKSSTFSSIGVKDFPTKVMFFQRRFEGIPFQSYQANVFIDFNPEQIRQQVIVPALAHKSSISREVKRAEACRPNDWSFKNDDLRKADGFSFQLRKYLYEIKTQPALKAKLSKALNYLHKFKTQQMPHDMKWEVWAKVRITEAKVLAYFRKIVRSQDKTERTGYVTVADRSGIRIKSFDSATRKKLNEMGAVGLYWIELVKNPELLIVHPLASELSRYKRLLRKRCAQYNKLQTPILKTKANAEVKSFLKAFKFINPENEVKSLTKLQRADMACQLSRPFGLLSWQQGSGKTVASAAAIKFYQNHSNVKNIFLIGPPIAIENTWIPFFERNQYEFFQIKTLSDIALIPQGKIIVIALTKLKEFKRPVMRYVRTISNNGLLVFDESDEITNYNSKRSHAVRDVFRRLRFKLLTTGTTTRNNLTELYGQLEVLYNNSMNFICDSRYLYKEEVIDGKFDIHQDLNWDFNGKPFPPKGGLQLFKSCFAPAKATVFGVQKHNQDIYNSDSLKAFVERSIITRKFKEIAGDGRYFLHTHKLVSKPFEAELYRQILEELHTILPSYYSSTGNYRKDAMLRIIRQLQLLIQSCSIPQHLAKVTETPAKAGYMLTLVNKFADERIMIGSNNVKGATYYANYFRKNTTRPVFFVTGESHNIKKRQQIVDEFKASKNGILVCTQQSLSSSINIPQCSRVIVESLQWNLPRIEQWYFRCIRFDSLRPTNVHFVVYTNSIEVNLMALLTAKERLNDFIKTLDLREHSEVMEDFDMDESFLDMLLEKVYDEDGNMSFRWGKEQQKIVA